MNQPDLFDARTITPRAHRNDPSSSHQAAREAKVFAGGQAEKVLAALRIHRRFTSAELAFAIEMDLYAVRRRLTDLLDIHRVERINPTPTTVPCFVSGKRVCRWDIA